MIKGPWWLGVLFILAHASIDAGPLLPLGLLIYAIIAGRWVVAASLAVGFGAFGILMLSMRGRSITAFESELAARQRASSAPWQLVAYSGIALGIVLALIGGQRHESRESVVARPSESGRRDSVSPESAQPWWSNQYPKLVETVGSTHEGSVTLQYRTGPRGEEEVRLTLRPFGEKGLEVHSNAPGSAIVRVNPETQEATRQQDRFEIMLRDEDGDGWADVVSLPLGMIAADESLLRDDGMMRLTGREDEAAFYAMWNIHVAYAVNRLLYDRDSVASPANDSRSPTSP